MKTTVDVAAQVYDVILSGQRWQSGCSNVTQIKWPFSLTHSNGLIDF